MTHPVLARMRDSDPRVRKQACREAADDPSAVLLVDALDEALADPDAGVRQAASDALARLAPDHGIVSEVLRRALHGDDRRRRWAAAFAKARLAPPDPGLLPVLVDALAAPEPDVRWAAARILVDLGRLHREALPVALGLARGDPNPVVRRMALFCLRELAPEEPATLEVLLEASRDHDPRLRRAALSSIAALETPPAAIVERLTRLRESDPDRVVRRLAETALALGSDQNIKASSE